MQLDKNTIVNFLREQGDTDKADEAAEQLPEQVDTDEHASMLESLGVDVESLTQRFTDGMDLPGM